MIKKNQSKFWLCLKKDKVVLFYILVFFLIVLFSFLAPWIATQDPYNPSELNILDAELPPKWIEGSDERFIFGTDDQGRDILSTILYGTRTSLIIGIGSVIIQLLIGITLGLFAGYFGGKIDNFLMRLADIQLSFSTMMVAIIVLALFQNLFDTAMYSKLAMFILILVIGIAQWPHYARTIRSSVLKEKKKEYIESAFILGLSTNKIIYRHLLPNCLSPILVISTVQIAEAIISEAALSFLGLGMPPSKPSLGSLISIGFHYVFSGSWWITVIPGLVLILLVLSINIIGDFLRNYFNPKIYKEL